jgi:hypothetical protein
VVHADGIDIDRVQRDHHLPPAVAAPARLLALKRGHWQIENACTIRKM